MIVSSKLDFGEMMEPTKILRGRRLAGRVGRREGEEEVSGVDLLLVEEVEEEEDDIP